MHCNSILLDDSDKEYQYGSLTYVSVITVLPVENTAITLVRGEGSFKEGSNAILDAMKDYQNYCDQLMLPIVVEIYQSTRYILFS